MLRLKGYSKVSNVEFAIIEPDGNISVIPTSQTRPATPKDLNINTKYEGITLPLIIDGEIQYNNLRFAKLDTTWLKQEIKTFGAQKPEDVFLAELDTEGKLYIDLFSGGTNSKPSMF